MWLGTGSSVFKIILKKNNMEGIIPPDVKIYYITILIKRE
jgi:hypothetical protein